MRSGSIVMAVRWVQRRRAPAPRWIGALLLVGLVAAAGPGAAATLNPGDILVANHDNGVLRVNPADGEQTFLLTPPADDSAVYTGVAVAANGHLFVLDAGFFGFVAAKVIRVNPDTGQQTPVSSGGSLAVPMGLAIAKNGDLLVADAEVVIRVNPDTGQQTPVSSRGYLVEGRGIAIAKNGDLFVVDALCCGGHGGVIRVNPDTGQQTPVSSGGHLISPHGIAIAANGDLLVADGSGLIRVNPAIPNQPPGNNQTVVSSGGHFAIPRGVGITTGGDLIVLDGLCCGGLNGGVIRVNPALGNQPPGNNQTPVARQGKLSQPWGMAIVPPPDPGDILIANGAGANILEVKSRPISPWSWEPTVVAAGGHLTNPVGIAIAANGDLLVADQGCCDVPSGVIRVSAVDGSQTPVASAASPGSPFVAPTGIAIAATGDLLVTDMSCCDGGNGGVIRVDPPVGMQPPVNNQTVVSSRGFFGNPAGIAIAANGDLLVVDPAIGNAGVIRVNPARGNQPPGANQTVVSSGGHFIAPSGIAIAANDDLLVADATINAAKVIRVNPAGSNQPPGANQTLVSSGGHFDAPTGIAVAASGDLFVVDPLCCGGFGGVIRVNPADGQQTVWAQGGNFVQPPGIAIRPRPQPGLPLPAACGGSVPCACGDRVVRDRTLRGTDPVTRTVCPGDGLIVAAGVTLDLGGATLRGQGAGAGVRIESGADDVAIRRGTVTGFATGVRGEGTIGVHVANVQVLDSARDGVNLTGEGHSVETAVIERSGGLGVAVIGNASRLSRLQVQGNGRAGVRIWGRGHTVQQSTIEGNGEAGAEVSGDANEVARLQVTGNGGDGVFAMGAGNRVTRNSATRNGDDGLEIQGERAAVESNRATSNAGAGLQIHGIDHAVSVNIAAQNAGTGLQLLGTTGSRFDRNRAENNGGFGIADDSAGTGTGGTANTYTQNICGRGNGEGSSSPPSLCR